MFGVVKTTKAYPTSLATSEEAFFILRAADLEVSIDSTNSSPATPKTEAVMMTIMLLEKPKYF